MGQFPGTAEPASLGEQVYVNRISIPFLRIQERRWLLACVDAAIVAGWMVAGYKLWRIVMRPSPTEMPGVPWAWVAGAAALWLVVSWLAGAYELDTADRFRRAARTTGTVALIALVAAVVAYYLFLKTYPRPALAFDALVAVPVSVLCWRAFYASALRRRSSVTRLLVVGNQTYYEALAQEAAAQQQYYQVLGFVTSGEAVHPRYLGAFSRLDELLSREVVHRLVVAPGQELSNDLITLLCRTVERGVEVVDFNAAYEEVAEKIAVEHVDDHWLAALPTRATTSSLEDAAMRAMDVAGALVGLAVTALLVPFIGLAIVLEDGGPIFYRQDRVGRGGTPFTVHKFRSMKSDAEVDGERWALRDDDRATAAGRFLRRTHLDELPQFWNVLKGEMSLVGPRPERPSFTHELSRTIPFYRLRLAVRPGMTGLKQLRVGYAATPEEHLEVLRHDLYYIKHRSVALNVLILARTIGAVLGMDGR